MMAELEDQQRLLEAEQLSPELASSDSVFSIPEVQLPIIGCEILEARSRFTVYKICVQLGQANNWFVFRRYSEFYNLYSALRQLYPHFYIQFPRKKYFGDNFDEKFLTFRRKGLQDFLNKVLELDNVLSQKVVIEFLCLDDPPGPYDSLEQSRAFITCLEESLHQLRRKHNHQSLEVNALKWHCTQLKAQRLVLLAALRTERAINGKDTLDGCDEHLLKEYLSANQLTSPLTQSYESLTPLRRSRPNSGSFRGRLSTSSSCNSLLEANVTLAKVSSPRTSWCDSKSTDTESIPLSQRQYKKPNTTHLPSYNDGGLFNKLLCRSTEALQKLKEVVKTTYIVEPNEKEVETKEQEGQGNEDALQSN